MRQSYGPTSCPSAAASAGKTCQNSTDLARAAVGCTGVLGRGMLIPGLCIAVCFMSGSRQRRQNARNSETGDLVLLRPSRSVDEALHLRDAVRTTRLP